ncbi:TRAP transporter substrate-binding protein [Paenibacillus thermoaerophilus]|uniref:TRAP transporter substrate-binding protein n=1 Tax=Paenibacillus thermoaerophilus TaxID=1215385 RepID=A0ABW2UWN7_9BACL|nr:TRAP transporter substrate-binding protein [Paenibacillus thermoaerophilus]TMV15914.1 TRAP transporter substrate-binding protein [Paenibacillus thermoaerophilus]
MRFMKKGIGTIGAVALLGTILAACGGGADKAPDNGGAAGGDSGPKYTFRLAETHPGDYPTTLGDKKFAELVKERTNGRIQIDVFPSAQLGEEKSVIEQVQLGAIEFTRVSTGALAAFNNQFGVFSLPYIFDNDDHLWRFLDSNEGTKLLDSLESSRMKGLAYYSSGARHFYATKPIKKVEDLKGLKIRVQQNKINMDLITALGASPTPMAYGEVYSSLQTGVIDGAENNYPSYYSSKHYDVAKNLILDQHQRVPEVLLISKTVWDKLSQADKDIIKQAALDSVATQKEEWAKYEKKSEEAVKAAGVTITEVTDPKPWQAAVKPVIDKYRNEYKEVLESIEKYKQ